MYIGYDLVWVFFSCSFLGWILETIAAAVKHKQFVNRGLINAPFCIIYGIADVILMIFSRELHGHWLFLGGVIISTVIEWTAGHLIEHMYHEKWWDYSGVKWNLDGYICLPVSVFWGLLAWIMMEWGNPLLKDVYHLFPRMAGKIIVWVLLVLVCIDMAATLILLSGRSKRIGQWEAVDSWLTGISSQLGKKIYTYIDTRIKRAYPDARRQEEQEKAKTIFAYGCGFYKVVCLFMIGALLGDIVETIYCRVTAGVWMSRSSVVWGPFSIVWGLAIAAATMLLYRYRDRSDMFLFAAGTFLGGAYEYICSVFTELVFGKVFWDYSEMPFNLGGRINLLYCFFWGLAAVVWLKVLYPYISAWIEKAPIRVGKIITWVMILFMCCNIVVSCMALIRSVQREEGVNASARWQQIMDDRFGSERMEKIYPNAMGVE